jgi:hypothetical protein
MRGGRLVGNRVGGRVGGRGIPRVDFVDGGVVHFVLFQGAGDVILDQHVARGGEFVENLNALWVCEGEAEGFLVAVYLHSHGAEVNV